MPQCVNVCNQNYFPSVEQLLGNYSWIWMPSQTTKAVSSGRYPGRVFQEQHYKKAYFLQSLLLIPLNIYIFFFILCVRKEKEQNGYKKPACFWKCQWALPGLSWGRKMLLFLIWCFLCRFYSEMQENEHSIHCLMLKTKEFHALQLNWNTLMYCIKPNQM